jgi:hypothetical protein
MRQRATRAPIGFAIAFACVVVTACTNEGTACYPGDWRHCECDAAAQGYQQCSSDGASYGPCDCSVAVPSVGSVADGGASSDANDGGLLGFLAACTDDSQCASHDCFPFNAYGPHCTQPCSKDSDCPPPSPGCSNKGQCKLH